MTRIALAAAIAAALGLLASGASADDPDAPEPLPVDLGKRVAICGKVLCPVSGFQCDDPSVVRVESSEKGPVVVGVKPGTTLCAAVASNYQRKVFRVTVK
jgi:hypothetical protein